MANLRENAAKRAAKRGATSQQQAQIRSGGTATPTQRQAPSIPVNPRSSGGQAGAARPTGQSAPTTSSGQPVNTTQLRPNQRRANQAILQQNANRAKTLLGTKGTVKTYIDPVTGKDTRTFKNGQPVKDTGTLSTQQITGVQAPTRGLQEASPINFESLEAAKQAARDEYTRTGTVSPATEAAIFNIENQGSDFTTSGRGAADIRADLQAQAGQQSTDPLIQSRGDQISSLVKQGQELASKSIDERLDIALGDRKGLFDTLSSLGVTTSSELGAWSADGTRESLFVTDRNVIRALEKAGLSGATDPTRGGKRFELSPSEIDDLLNQGKEVLSGKDIADVEQQITEQLDAADQENQAGAGEREEQFQKEAEQTDVNAAAAQNQAISQANQQTKTTIDNAALEQIIGSIPPEIEGGDMIANTFREIFQNRAETDSLMNSLQQGRADALDESFDNVSGMVQKAQNRAKENYSTIDNVLSENLDRNNKLLAQREANDQAKLTFQEDKLVRQQKDILQSNIDTMTASLALRGGFGSESGLAEIRDAKTGGEQAIIDLQKEFGFKRADLSIAYTDSYNKAFEGYQNSTLKAWTTMEGNLANLELQGIANERARATAKDGIFKDMISQVSESRKQYAQDLKDATNSVLGIIADKRKAEIESMVSEDEAFDFADKIRKEINALKPVQEYDDIASKLSGMQAAQEIFQNNPEGGGKGARDIAVLKLYEKILDPDSAVRDGEVQLQLNAQGITRGLIQKAIDNFGLTGTAGGAGLDERQIQAMIDTAEQVVAKSREKMVQKTAPQLMSIKAFNKRRGTDIAMDQVFTPDVIDSFGGYGSEAEDLFGAFDETFGETSFEDTPFNEPQTPRQYSGVRDWASTIGNGRIIPGSEFHTGVDKHSIDIDGEVGDPVTAFEGGRVISVGTSRDSGYGNHVIVEKDGKQYLYAHMDSVNVKTGQELQSGFNIGTIGNTGNVRDINGNKVSKDQLAKGVGSHLHVRVTQNGQPVAFGDTTQVASEKTVEESAPRVQIAMTEGGQQQGGLLIAPTGELQVQEIAEFRTEGGGITRVNMKKNPEQYEALKNHPDVTFLQFK